MSRERPTQPQVIQIMPAVGWHAIWADEDGSVWADPLIGWALVEIDADNITRSSDADVYLMPVVRPGRQAGVGLSIQPSPVTESPEDQHGFLGYAPPDEDYDTEWADRAREHAENSARGKARRAQEAEPQS